MKKKLSFYHRNLLFLLTVKHNSSQGKVNISKNGEISINESGNFFGWLTPKKIDFLEATQLILESIHKGKEEIAFVGALCSKALGNLMIFNDREKAIEYMFIADLTNENPSYEEVDDSAEEITLNTPVQDIKIVRYKGSAKEELVEILNNVPHIIFSK